MTDDRTYRMLIPGALFLFTILGFSVLDPTLDFLKFLKTHNISGSTALSILVLGGSLCVIVAGYVLTTLDYTNYSPDVPLCKEQEDNLVRRIRHHGANTSENLIRLSIYTHLSLARKDEKLMNHLSRSWSNEMVSYSSSKAIIRAIALYLVVFSLRNLWELVNWKLFSDNIWTDLGRIFESEASMKEALESIGWFLLTCAYLFLLLCMRNAIDSSRASMRKYRADLYRALLATDPVLDTEIKIEKKFDFQPRSRRTLSTITRTKTTKSLDSPK